MHDCADLLASQGDHTQDVVDALAIPEVRRVADELTAFEPHLIRELGETGAWDVYDLHEDHEVNLQRIAWIVACDDKENKREGAGHDAYDVT